MSKYQNLLPEYNKKHLFPLRNIPLKIFKFTSTKERVEKNNNGDISIKNQNLAMDFWLKEIGKRFDKNDIWKKHLRYKKRINI